MRTLDPNGEEKQFNPNTYIEIKDNGAGIHPKMFMDVLTSFGYNSVKSKSNYCFSEHGIGLKLSCLRLAATTLIVTKTKPVIECGIASYFVSFGLLSHDFMKKADSINGFLVAPIVSLEIRNRRISKNLTPEPDHFLSLIASFTCGLFKTSEKLLSYSLNTMPEQGGTNLFLFNLVR
jgi:hypothetical protein